MYVCIIVEILEIEYRLFRVHRRLSSQYTDQRAKLSPIVNHSVIKHCSLNRLACYFTILLLAFRFLHTFSLLCGLVTVETRKSRSKNQVDKMRWQKYLIINGRIGPRRNSVSLIDSDLNRAKEPASMFLRKISKKSSSFDLLILYRDNFVKRRPISLYFLFRTSFERMKYFIFHTFLNSKIESKKLKLYTYIWVI